MDETMNNSSQTWEDEKMETAVLALLLALRPAQFTSEEMVREVGGGGADYGARDAVERAIERLDSVGLLHRHGEMIVPSRAAQRFYELFE